MMCHHFYREMLEHCEEENGFIERRIFSDLLNVTGSNILQKILMKIVYHECWHHAC